MASIAVWSMPASMPNSGANLDRVRIALLVSGIGFGILAAVFLSRPLATNANLLIGVAGVSATFSGFIIAVKTLLGDVSAMLPGNWRLGVVQSREIARRFTRLNLIFSLYVISTFACLAFAAFADEPTRFWPADAVLAFILAFTAVSTLELPRSLRSIQQERMDAIIEARRKSQSAN